MGIKHSNSITFSNFSIIYKTILYYGIVTLICVGLALSILLPTMNGLFKAISEAQLLEKSLEAFKSFMVGEISLDTSLRMVGRYINQLGYILDAHGGALSAFYVVVFLLGFVYRFVIALISVPVGDTINMFISSNMKYGFTSNYIKNFRLSVKFSLASTLISFPINMAIYYFVYYFTKLLFNYLSIFALPIGLILIIVLFSVKFALLAGWMPTYLNKDMGVLKSLKSSMKLAKANFKMLFITSSLLYLVVYSVIAVTMIPTFGITVIVGTAYTLILLKVLELVYYYIYNERKYYIDNFTIIDTRDIKSTDIEEETQA